MKQERIDGPTPNGGEYAIAYYLDENRDLTEKSRAKLVEIVEYDSSENIIWRTYGELEPATEPSKKP